MKNLPLNPSKMRYYIKATAAHDLSDQQVERGETPEVIIIMDKGEILGKQSYDVQNIQTKGIYKNISIDTLIVRRK